MSDKGAMDESIDEVSEHSMLEALRALEDGDLAVSPGARPYVETLAALPLALEPIEPSAGVREALMAEIGPSAAAEVERFSTRPTPARTGTRWLLPIAAVLALALFAVSAKQYVQLASQERQIDQQSARIAQLQQELTDVMPAAQRPPEWMVASGTELCALQPRQAVDGEASGVDTKGWLFVRQDHQHWYVALEGLQPAPEGQVYELWFLVDGEMVSGGTFRPDAQGRASLTSETMPNPVSGIAVTLEFNDGDGVPSDHTILYGDEVMLIL